MKKSQHKQGIYIFRALFTRIFIKNKKISIKTYFNTHVSPTNSRLEHLSQVYS